MTPALAHALVFACAVTCAEMLPSAARFWLTKWKASVVDQMSPPPPSSDHWPPVRVCWPVGSGLPMSEQVQPVGQDRPGGGNSVAATAGAPNPTVELVPWLWEVTATPPSSVPLSPATVRVDPVTAVQVVPSGEV